MAEFFNFIASIFRSFFNGMSQLISGYPRFFALLVCVSIFLYTLKHVEGFGEMAAQVIVFIGIIWLAKTMMTSQKKKR